MPLFDLGNNQIKKFCDIQKDCFEHAFTNMQFMINQAVKVNDAWLTHVPWLSTTHKKAISAGLVVSTLQISLVNAMHQEAKALMGCVAAP